MGLKGDASLECTEKAVAKGEDFESKATWGCILQR
jgi:hypothetical protein